jgi:hypothetical protein
MIDRETELVDNGHLQVRRFFRRGNHNPLICDDCRKTQHSDIVHIVPLRRYTTRCGDDSYTYFGAPTESWLCEKCRSHRGRRDWVAPVSEGSPELTAARQQREAAVPASSANASVRGGGTPYPARGVGD